MNRIQELINVLGDDNVKGRAAIAKANRTCKICGKPAVFFRTSQAELEYRLSLICQSCQDHYLSEWKREAGKSRAGGCYANTKSSQEPGISTTKDTDPIEPSPRQAAGRVQLIATRWIKIIL